MTVVPPSSLSVRAELRAIRQSTVFGSALRLQKLLEYLVEETLAGNPLKESILGVAVFGRPPGYDPKQDSVVRTEVRRLRAKLVEYYAREGAADKIVIDLPKGSYVPAFRFRDNTAPVANPPDAARRARKLWTTAGAALLLACVAAILAAPGFERPAAGGASRRSVAVLDFRNLTARPESAWLASAIPEMISADLANGRQIRTIAGENVSRMEAELALAPVASPSRQTLSAIRRNVGADIVVSGAYADLGAAAGGRVRLDVRAADAQTGEVIAALSETGTEPEILDVITRAGARLRSGLQVESAPTADLALRETTPRDPAAARAYADGLAHLRRADYLAGRDLLQRCTQLETGFAPAHAALSSAFAKLGYESLARDEGKRAYDLSRGMRNDEARLAIEAQYWDADHKPSRAAEVYARLFARHPDAIEYGLHLADAQTSDNKTDDALRTLEALRRLPATGAGDPRIDMEAAHVLAARSDYHQSVVLAAAAARKAAEANAGLLYAHAISLESGLDWYLGDAHWRGLSEEALKICRQFQDKACIAAVLRRFGNSSMMALDLDSADGYFAQALTLAREIGSLGEETNELNGMALSAHARGDLRNAAAIEERLVTLSRQTGQRGLEQSSLANLGDILLYMGQVNAARDHIEAAETIARAIHEPDALAEDLASRAELYLIQGDLPRALQLCGEALENARKSGAVNSQIAVLSRKVRVLLAGDDVAGARAALRDYQRLRGGNVNMTAMGDWNLAAAVAFAERKPAEAAALAADVVRKVSALRLPAQQARAEILLAESLLAQGERAKARASAGQAWSRVRDSQSRLLRMEVGTAYARVTGHTEVLPAIISEARSSGAYAPELEARLAQAELAHDPARLAAIRQEALSRGFRYLARRADESSR